MSICNNTFPNCGFNIMSFSTLHPLMKWEVSNTRNWLYGVNFVFSSPLKSHLTIRHSEIWQPLEHQIIWYVRVYWKFINLSHCWPYVKAQTGLLMRKRFRAMMSNYCTPHQYAFQPSSVHQRNWTHISTTQLQRHEDGMARSLYDNFPQRKVLATTRINLFVPLSLKLLQHFLIW